MRVGQELRLVEQHKNQTNQAFSSTTRTLCLLHVVVPTWLTPTSPPRSEVISQTLL